MNFFKKKKKKKKKQLQFLLKKKKLAMQFSLHKTNYLGIKYKLHSKTHEFILVIKNIDNLDFVFFIFLAALCGMWDLSSPTRDRTRTLGSESAES